MLVDLVGITVLLQQVSEDTDSSHPQNLFGHTGILGTTTLTETGVTALKTKKYIKFYNKVHKNKANVAYLSSGLSLFTGTEAGVHLVGFLDDKTVLDETTDVLTGVGVGDFANLIGVKPNLAFTAL